MSAGRAGSDRLSRLPKRFYEKASHEKSGEEQEWIVLLDGKAIKTPAQTRFVVPSGPLAEAIAAEWKAQEEHIDPDTMPLMRLANAALCQILGREDAVADEIAAYAASDLLCYRAEIPQGLIEAQTQKWDPVLVWFKAEWGVDFTLASGIIHAGQPEESLRRVRRELGRADAFTMSVLHTITTLTGSVLLALAHAYGPLSTEEAWAAAHVDEDWQISQWGEDTDASTRSEARGKEMMAAARFLEFLQP